MKQLISLILIICLQYTIADAEDAVTPVFKDISFGAKYNEVADKLKKLYGCDQDITPPTLQRCDKGLIELGTSWATLKGFKLSDGLNLDTRFYFDRNNRFYLLSFITPYQDWPVLKDILKLRYGGDPECPNLATPLMMTFPAAISCAWETKDSSIALLPSINGNVMGYVISKELSKAQRLLDEKLRATQIEKGVQTLR